MPLSRNEITRTQSLRLKAASVCLALGSVVAVGAGGLQAAETIDFNRQIRPLLSDNCFACHGPDEKQRKADLRLDTEPGAFADLGGYRALVPGQPDQSEAWKRIAASDPDDLMPPPDSGKSLKREEIETIRQWISQGAKWQGHWAFEPPARPKIPAALDSEWPRTPVDYFVLDRLRSEGLEPAEAAARPQLIRRVTFDLTGLPPTLEEIDAFLADDSPNAYEKVVDRLLNSQHYGEHMARFWLDAVRYGDTHGLHLDNYREIWPYRDWVIRAFNENKPFDEFTVEQLAGDLLPDPTRDQLIASGYNRCNVTTSEGGSIEEEVYVRNVVDRVETTGTVFMGLTLGCAVCHDHKYDPISMKDFYSLFAFFNSIDGRALDGNRKDHAPVIRVPSELQRRDLKHHDEAIESAAKQLAAPMPEVDVAQRAWEQSLKPRQSVAEVSWKVVDPVRFIAFSGATLSEQDDHSLLASGENPAREAYEIIGQVDGGDLTAIRLEALTHDSMTGKSLARSSNGNAVMTEFIAEVAPADDPERLRKIRFTRTWADHEQPGGDFGIGNALDGRDETGWGVEGHNRKEKRTAIFVADEPFGFPGGTVLRVRTEFQSKHSRHHFGRVRLAVTSAKQFPHFHPRIELGDWYAIGTFTSASFGKRSYRARLGPEAKPVKLEQTFNDNGETLKWERKPHWRDGVVHGDLPGRESANYLHRSVYSSVAQKVKIHVGSGDALKVFLNEKEVFGREVEREAAPDQDTVELNLPPGDGSLMLKVVNYQGGAGFCFRMEGEHVEPPAAIVELARKEPAERTKAEEARLREYYRFRVSDDFEVAQLRNRLWAARKSWHDVERSIPTTLVFREQAEPREAFVLVRGQYDQKGEKVDRRTPGALPGMPEDGPRNRLGFARWLLHEDHPLTARVAVNRFWQQAFGRGLVRTAEDFGSQGTPPTHPELLDWLAVDFREGGWNVQRLMKTIVMSATYRQSSKVSHELVTRDPENRLLARGPRYRLDAEMLRDQALAVSGLLQHRIGGPSVKPPQPDGLWFAVGYSGSNTVRFSADKGSKIYRRSIYTFWKRTSPPPQMSTFDAPSRESCTVQRERTNTPLQALVLMNEPQFFEAARALAERAIEHSGDRDERLAFMFRKLTARHPGPGDLEDLRALLQDHLKRFRADSDAAREVIRTGATAPNAALDPAELAAWTMVANLLLNLDETIVKG